MKKHKTTPAEAFQERDILFNLDHPNIIKLLGTFYSGDIFFLFELCQGNYIQISSTTILVFYAVCKRFDGSRLGDTGQFINEIRNQHLPSIIMQLLSAVDYIHGKSTVRFWSRYHTSCSKQN
jgi:serine/threonine protein kinase